MSFSSLPVEIQEYVFLHLRNDELVKIRQVCHNFLNLANHLLNRRHQSVWDWNPHFRYSDAESWMNCGKMRYGIVAGGVPKCCSKHDFDRLTVDRILANSMIIWMETSRETSAKLNEVVKPLLMKHGVQLTCLTINFLECGPRSFSLSDMTVLFDELPNLRNFGFRACNYSIRQPGTYKTRRSDFPALPQLEVLDLELNENVLFMDAILKAYAKQIKRLSISGKTVYYSEYLSNVIEELGQKTNQKSINASIFDQLSDLKIGEVNCLFEPRGNNDAPRWKFAGKHIFTKLTSLPPWPLQRLSLNMDDWMMHKMDRWGIAIPELLRMIANFSQTLKELYLCIEYVDKSFDLQEWHYSNVCSKDDYDGKSKISIIPSCPKLRKVCVDSVLIETPLLTRILQGFGKVEELQFLMWNHHGSRWSSRYRRSTLEEDLFSPSTSTYLPTVMEKYRKELPSLKKFFVLRENYFPAVYENVLSK